jgi:low affinity Fe/Cu permease
MVFLIQNTQNRDAKVMQLKLDELIRATHTARNKLVDMEAMSDEELAALQKEFKELHRRAGEALEERRQHDRRITPPRSEPASTRAAAAAGQGNGQD